MSVQALTPRQKLTDIKITRPSQVDTVKTQHGTAIYFNDPTQAAVALASAYLGGGVRTLSRQRTIPLPHRVVLPKAFGDLPAHSASLVIPANAAPADAVQAFATGPLEYQGIQQDNYVITVLGATLEIGNPDPVAPYQLERTFLCGIPRLSKVAGTWFGEPDYVVTEDGRADYAWAFFNVTNGTFSAGLVHQGAAAAHLDCPTIGPPVLTATAFDKSTPPSQPLTLESGTIVTLQYAAGNDADDAMDFAIHYRVVRPDRRPGPQLALVSAVPHCLVRFPPPACPAIEPVDRAGVLELAVPVRLQVERRRRRTTPQR